VRRFRGSFLLRSWQVGVAERFEVEHIQTGAHVTLPSLADACEWIVAQHAAAERAPATDGEARGDGEPRREGSR
jgi:hypothetical protein